MKKIYLISILFVIAAFVACEDKTTEKPNPPVDALFYSYYGYVNYSELPITIDVYWGIEEPSKQESITIYPGDKYENRIAGAGYYPAPFNAGGHIFVTVSNTEKQFTQKETEKLAYLFNKSLYGLLYEEESLKVYRYIFTSEDFTSAKPTNDSEIDSFMAAKTSTAGYHTYTSYYGYINQSSYPTITVEYHSSDYGYAPITKSEKFALNQWDKYEIHFTDGKYTAFPGPFYAAKSGDYVTVSNGEKQFVQKFEDGGHLFDLKSYKLVWDENELKKAYEYAFTDDDFKDAKPIKE